MRPRSGRSDAASSRTDHDRSIAFPRQSPRMRAGHSRCAVMVAPISCAASWVASLIAAALREEQQARPQAWIPTEAIAVLRCRGSDLVIQHTNVQLQDLPVLRMVNRGGRDMATGLAIGHQIGHRQLADLAAVPTVP